jgi:hypothetical protein
MSARIFAFLRRSAGPRDWSAQELAEFYRVEAALIQAGLRVVSERGLTDEGEPWFVFCRTEDDEVIIHFARIDGRYLISAPAYCGTATGPDFPALVRGMIERHPVLRPRPKGDNLFFHPAALLVVLVTSAFLKSGHAAEAAPAKPATAEASTWKHREAIAVGVPAGAEARAEHEALVMLALTAIAAPAQAEPAAPVASAFVHPAEWAERPAAQGLLALPPGASVIASHPVRSNFAPPMPAFAMEASHSASAHIAPQPDPTPLLGVAHAIGTVISPLVMVASGAETNLSLPDLTPGAQLLPLSALSGIPKAELNLLQALSVPDHVYYVATFPAIFSTALQTGVHREVAHADTTHAPSPSHAPSPPVAEPAPAPPPAAEPPAVQASASAPEAVSPTPAPAVGTTPSSAVVPATDMSSVLGAVEQFEAAAVHSALVLTPHAAIFYDVAATTSNYGAVAAVTYDFGDGFSISLVGLPAELPHAVLHV